MTTLLIAAITSTAIAYETAILPKPVKFSELPGSYVTEGGVPLQAVARFKTDASVPKEGYRLKIRTDGIEIEHSTEAGRFYALKTLGQIARTRPDGKVAYKCVDIDDAPYYRHRGVMLDEGRHFFGKKAVLNLLDLMAEYKMNVFHWHLTEDQGWRLEIKSHPELVEYGAIRPSSPKRGTIDVDDGIPYGPYFHTQEDVKEVLAYAKERHITVYPEIEMPGHIRALIAAHPELLCDGVKLDRRTAWSEWGVSDHVLCLGNPATYKLLDDIFGEVARLFPDAPYIFTGGEECTSKNWAQCPKCREVMKREGITEPRKLQAWFSHRIYDLIKSHGKRMAGWSSLLDDGLPKDVMMGTGYGTYGDGPAGLGYEAVMSPVEYCYFIHSQGVPNDPYDYAWFWSGSVSVNQVYSFDPCYGVSPKFRKHVAGGEAHMWSEYTNDIADLEWKLWPRCFAMAEALWSHPEIAFEINDFARRLKVHSGKLRARGINVAPFELQGMQRLYKK